MKRNWIVVNIALEHVSSTTGKNAGEFFGPCTKAEAHHLLNCFGECPGNITIAVPLREQQEALDLLNEPPLRRLRNKRAKPDRELGLELAIAAAGGVRALARLVNLSSPTVAVWHRIPQKHVSLIEQKISIPRAKLRPDIYDPPPSQGWTLALEAGSKVHLTEQGGNP